MSSKTKFGLGFFIIMLAGIITALLLYASYFLNNSNYFLPGVKISGVDVKGLNVEQAGKIIDEHFESVLNYSLDFCWQDFKETIVLKDICEPFEGNDIAKTVWKQELSRPWYKKIGSLKGSTLVNYPIKLKYREDKIQQIGQEWEKKWNVAPENARLQIDSQKGLQIIPEKRGIKVDVPATFKQLPESFEGKINKNYNIITIATEPDITAEDLKNMGKLASYTTWYNPGMVDRSHNLRQAANKINGYILPSQQVFSFNEVVGKRDLENDYRDAMVIVNGKYQLGMGGGICQVSSTLYNAVLLAGLDIIERHNHALAVAYVPLGRDATVAYGLQDFKFKNNTDNSIYLQSYTKSGELTVNVFGNLTYKQNIKITNIVDKVNNFKIIEEVSHNLQPGAREIQNKGIPGYVVRAFRTFYDNNGNISKQQQLSKDIYRPLDELVYVGPELPKVLPDVEPPSDPAKKDDINPPENNETTEPTDNSSNGKENSKESDKESTNREPNGLDNNGQPADDSANDI